MSYPAILIISAAFHALWNFALKKSEHKLGASLAFMIVATVFNAAYGLATSTIPALSWTLVIGTVGAGIFEGLYFYLLNSAYSKQSLGVAYTIMRGGAMVMVWVISTLALDEIVSSRDILCIFAILVGISCIQRSLSVADFFRAGNHAAHACAICIAGYHICYGLAARTGASPALVFASAMTVGIIIYLSCGRASATAALADALKTEKALVFSGGLACGTSFLLFITALVTVDPGRAISLRNTSVAFGAILSFLAAEKLSSVQWVGVVCVIIGVMGM